MDLEKPFKDVPDGVGRYGVVGHDIAFTLSPAMHNAAMRTFGLAAVYRTIDVAPAEWDEFVRRARADDRLRGFNVTIPHKVAARALGDGAEWDFVGAVNTVKRVPGGWRVANTDLEGFYSDAVDRGVVFRDRTVLLIGAGGAARAVLGALTLHPENPPRKILVINRTDENATRMIDDMALRGAASLRDLRRSGTLGAVAFHRRDAAAAEAHVVINATSAVDDPVFSPGALREGVVVYDLNYRARTALMNAAAARGGTAIDGLGMLVNQGALAFEFWFGDALKNGNLKKKVEYSSENLRRVMRDAAEKALREKEKP